MVHYGHANAIRQVRNAFLLPFYGKVMFSVCLSTRGVPPSPVTSPVPGPVRKGVRPTQDSRVPPPP